MVSQTWLSYGVNAVDGHAAEREVVDYSPEIQTRAAGDFMHPESAITTVGDFSPRLRLDCACDQMVFASLECNLLQGEELRLPAGSKAQTGLSHGLISALVPVRFSSNDIIVLGNSKEYG